MPEITFTLGKDIDQHDINMLKRSLHDLKSGDRVIIRMEAADSHEAGKVTDELVRQGFDYQPHGGSGIEYFLTAEKR